MEKKVILVTGANRGIGFEIVRQLAKQGHDVILTARDALKGRKAVEKLAAEWLTVGHIQLDVTDNRQIFEAFEIVRNEYNHLDVLINNAGIMSKNDRSILHANDSLVNEIIKTNALAPLEMVQAFAPLISKGGRVIMMSSGGGSMTDPIGGWSPVYCVSKSMLNSITRHLAYALAEKGVSVNAMCPGWVRTDMGGITAPRNVAEGADTAVWLATSDNIPTGKIWRNRKEIPW
jgi:NAD(P)-dependent dehydrogenase (short-subunit alcohol dehydrogenase family)